MKKVLTLALVLVLALSVVAYATTSEVANKTGLGTIISVAKSKDATAEAKGFAQVDTTMASVTVDAEGKIVSVSIDVAQTKVGVTAAGVVLKDEVKLLTKKELGADYGMIKASTIGKEWFEQIAALEAWMVGKTIEEIKAIPFTERDATHMFVPNTPDLVASVTISIEGYIAAVEEAIANANSDSAPNYVDISAKEAKELIDGNPDVVIIDVSPKYDQGHIPGAINYYLGDGSLDEAIPTLDKSKTYLVYCHVDSVAIAGAEKLIEAGFEKVYRLEGNYSAWVDAGYPVEK